MTGRTLGSKNQMSTPPMDSEVQAEMDFGFAESLMSIKKRISNFEH